MSEVASSPSGPSAPGARTRQPAAPARPQRSRPAAPAPRWAASPALGRAELVCAALAGVALAVITSWPLIAHRPSRIAPDLADPVRTSWQIAWVGHAMLHHPLHLFDANVFYPHPLSLAFSDSLLWDGPGAL